MTSRMKMNKKMKMTSRMKMNKKMTGMLRVKKVIMDLFKSKTSKRLINKTYKKKHTKDNKMLIFMGSRLMNRIWKNTRTREILKKSNSSRKI